MDASRTADMSYLFVMLITNHLGSKGIELRPQKIRFEEISTRWLQKSSISMHVLMDGSKSDRKVCDQQVAVIARFALYGHVQPLSSSGASRNELSILS